MSRATAVRTEPVEFAPQAIVECDELLQLSASQLYPLLWARKVSPVELLEKLLDRITELQPRLNAFVTVASDQAIEAAKRAETEIMRGAWRGRLHGIPFSVKDLIATAGITTTMGSTMLRSNVPERDAACVGRLRAAGAILIGKSTTSEFGHAYATKGKLFGETMNPRRLDLTCGGSSGGAAVAVASHQGPLALATDGGGSIRVPAACCGVYGLKPTVGSIPQPEGDYLFSGLAQIGPIAGTPNDIRLMLDVLTGSDDRDPFAMSLPELRRSLTRPLRSFRVGVIEDVGAGLPALTISKALHEAIRRLEHSGAQVTFIKMDFAQFVPAASLIAAVSLASRFCDSSQEQISALDNSTARLIRQGLCVAGPAVLNAQVERSRCFRMVQSAFGQFDFLLTPTLASLPRPSVLLDDIEDIADVMRNWCPYTFPLNLSGHPALSIPCASTPDSIPLSVQIVGPWYSEYDLLHVAELMAIEID